MAIESVPLYQQQIAFAIGLLGVYAGWRGTISKMTGFFDLSSAAKNLLYGIVVGMIFAVIVDSYVLFELLNSKFNCSSLESEKLFLPCNIKVLVFDTSLSLKYCI